MLFPNPYTTQLVAQWCNAFDVELTDYIEADPIAGAQNYQYRFEIPGSYVRQIKTNSISSSLHLGWYTSPLSSGETYDVSVRVKVGGTWGGFGPICQLSISAQAPDVADLRSEMTEPVSVSIFPNPSYDGLVSISIENIPEELADVFVEIYDLNGRIVQNQQYELPGVSTLLLRNEQELVSGLYLLRITLGETVLMERVIVD